MSDAPRDPSQQSQTPSPAAGRAAESGGDRLIRGLKTAGLGLLLAVAGIGAMVYMGSQGLTGSAAFAAVGLLLVGAFFLLKGAVLAIWGAVARSRS
ncbi:hypothetical protein [Pseudactinotalea suaedae]|uniref:hypothetical protein n=1 Tax=Pseudactinotalea suaedae TaxID=1524924 RepID=UPI0012E0EA8C|nr:hypothetical protein [Pseudactinotalea suaedae]